MTQHAACPASTRIFLVSLDTSEPVAACSVFVEGHAHRRGAEMGPNELTEEIIGAGIEVHRALGPGLLESTYEECLCRELALRCIVFERQYALHVEY